MAYFVERDSIVREIWKKGDTVLFIFTGASAEFALNKAVDWLYFTGRLPSDPFGRLFTTVSYARDIIFSEYSDAIRAIDKITSIHKGVEQQRGAQIPDWAYRDVLFMLIDYSIRSYEVLERNLSELEKTEVFNVFKRVGLRMGIEGLPNSFSEWQVMRQSHIKENLQYSNFTNDLYKQYKKHLGIIRYQILKQAQVLVVPESISDYLSLGKIHWLAPVLKLYKFLSIVNLQGTIKYVFLPSAYKRQIKELDLII